MFRIFASNRLALIGLFVLALFSLAAMAAPAVTRYDPNAIDLANAFSLPSAAHWFGQDSKGSDIFSRVIFGARVSLMIGFVCVSLSALIGIVIGAAAAEQGGIADHCWLALIDIFLAFPGFLLALAIAAFTGPGFLNLILAISLAGWVPFARLTRGEILAIREREFVLAARAAGANSFRLFFFHILPNILAPILIQATFAMAGVLIVEGSLSFLGLGLPPEIPSWGAMLNSGRNHFMRAQHLSIFPGLALMLLVMAFNFIGDGLRDWLDPKQIRRLN